MRCANLSDDWLWRAIAQNTERLSALIHLELGEADPASMHPRVTGMKYDVGTTFKHPWVRNQTDKKPTTCIITQIRDGVIYFRGYRSNRKLSSWTGELSEIAFETHFVLRNALRTEDQ